ncbi:MAG: hypothetical protein R2849_20400 [Thermomicrobiales bacterium]
MFVSTADAADELAPWDAAEQVRRSMFTAQGSLLRGDADEAETEVTGAAQFYDEHLAATIADRAPHAADHIAAAFADAHESVADGDGPGLALARAWIWGGMLEAGTLVAISSAGSR